MNKPEASQSDVPSTKRYSGLTESLEEIQRAVDILDDFAVTLSEWSKAFRTLGLTAMAKNCSSEMLRLDDTAERLRKAKTDLSFDAFKQAEQNAFNMLGVAVAVASISKEKVNEP